MWQMDPNMYSDWDLGDLQLLTALTLDVKNPSLLFLIFELVIKEIYKKLY